METEVAALDGASPTAPNASRTRTLESFPNAPADEPDWDSLRNRPLSLAEKREVRDYYAAGYVQGNIYEERHRLHIEISQYRATLMQCVFPDHGKVLDMGCSTGGDLEEFRRMGIDTWGFDLCPDLPDVAIPAARPYVRIGRPDHIPYSAEEGFETLVSYDVLEHVPVNDLQGFPDELTRLGIRNMALIIAADTISPGHITIQPTEWWEELLGRAGFRMLREKDPVLRDLPFPWAWSGEKQHAIYSRYEGSGSPPNGWNQVPGHLFFIRD